MCFGEGRPPLSLNSQNKNHAQEESKFQSLEGSINEAIEYAEEAKEVAVAE